ncbi:MAG: helix-hairpin-helix domain-containing protein [Flavobacteriales bacterium]
MNYEDLKDYFSFSKKEKKGISVLLFFIVAITIINWTIPYFLKKEFPSTQLSYASFSESDSSEFIDSFDNQFRQNKANYLNDEEENIDFFFHQDSVLYQQKNEYTFEKKKWKKLEIKINSCDSAELTTIRGIGPWSASKIIRNRIKLGGFYSFEQLNFLKPEIFDSLKTHCLIDLENVRYIEINHIPDSIIKFTSLLSYTECKAVLAYKRQHGNYSSCRDLKKCLILTDDQIDKLCPYLKFD